LTDLHLLSLGMIEEVFSATGNNETDQNRRINKRGE
jgi:hypothetical protein